MNGSFQTYFDFGVSDFDVLIVSVFDVSDFYFSSPYRILTGFAPFESCERQLSNGANPVEI